MKIEQIWKALDSDKEVNWNHDGYEVHAVSYSRGINKFSALSYRDGKALRITCKSNGFGSLIQSSDLSSCFIKEES